MAIVERNPEYKIPMFTSTRDIPCFWCTTVIKAGEQAVGHQERASCLECSKRAPLAAL